ncbi:hypothetical protein D3C75_643940 [compost metagenome]
MERTNRSRRKPCRNQQNKQARPFKEHGQIQANTAPVKQETQHDSSAQTEHCAKRRHDADILLERCQQEEYRLEAFTGDGEEHH